MNNRVTAEIVTLYATVSMLHSRLTTLLREVDDLPRPPSWDDEEYCCWEDLNRKDKATFYELIECVSPTSRLKEWSDVR